MIHLPEPESRATVDAIVRAQPMPPGYSMTVLSRRDVDEAYRLVMSTMVSAEDSPALVPISLEQYERRFASEPTGWTPHGSFSLGIRRIDDGRLVGTCSWDTEYPGSPVRFVDVLPGLDRADVAYGCSMAIRPADRRRGFARLLDDAGRSCVDALRGVLVIIIVHTNRAILRMIPEHPIISSVPDVEAMGEGAWVYYQAPGPAPGVRFSLAGEPLARVPIDDPAALARWLDGRAVARYDGAAHFEIHPWVGAG